LFYYRSIADKKYCSIMTDAEFITKLRQTPFDISPEEFERKVLLDYINITSYDLLIGHKLAESLLEKIIGLQIDVSALGDCTILDCNLSDNDMVERITKIYTHLFSIRGLWVTGASKIAHLLNDKLLIQLNPYILAHFKLSENVPGLLDWFRIIQGSAVQVTDNFRDNGFSGIPEAFISEKLGYIKHGCHKSLVKYLDEYYWMRFTDALPIPPPWYPS